MSYKYGSRPILDVFPGAQAAYSLRRLSSTYTGSCITVRRSSDNTTTNIGFYRNSLDLNSLLNFVGTGNGFVTTWFDQSGNNVNLIQGTQASQFVIVLSGQTFFEGNDIVMDAIGTNRAFLRNTNTTTLNDWTVYLKSRATTLFSHYVGHPSSSNGIMQHVSVQGYGYFSGSYNSIGGGTSSYSTTYRKLQAKRNSITTNVRGYINGLNRGNANINIGLNISTSAQIFGNFAGGGYQGTVRECIIYPVEHDDATLLTINNMM